MRDTVHLPIRARGASTPPLGRVKTECIAPAMVDATIPGVTDGQRNRGSKPNWNSQFTRPMWGGFGGGLLQSTAAWPR